MTLLIIILNVLFSALVIFAIVGLHLHAIAKSRTEGAPAPTGTRLAVATVRPRRYFRVPAAARSRARGGALQASAPARS